MPDTLKDHGRQYPLWAYQEVTLADLSSAASIEVIDLPPNAVIIGGFSEVTEAFNDSTTYVANIGITGTATAFETGQDLTSLTNPAVEFAAGLFTNTGATGTAVTMAATAGTGDATAGKVRIGVGYILPNRANENQPY